MGVARRRTILWEDFLCVKVFLPFPWEWEITVCIDEKLLMRMSASLVGTNKKNFFSQLTIVTAFHVALRRRKLNDPFGYLRILEERASYKI